MEQRIVAQQQVQNHDVAELSTTVPSTEACRSPIISSSENSTAAIGVLNAAASAAAQPTGTSAFVCFALSPRLRAITDAIPAPICTEGPSRPNAIPLASDSEQQKNFPMTVRSEILPSLMNNANFVCGIPLPRANGKYRHRRYPVTSAPAVGTRMRRHPAPPGGYIRTASRPVRRINATTPTKAPIKILRTSES
jgi:hypothetical protein